LKIGDIVRVGMPSSPTGTVYPSAGVVVDIRDLPHPPKEKETTQILNLMKLVGRQVDVLWASGELSKNFAENSLVIITDDHDNSAG